MNHHPWNEADGFNFFFSFFFCKNKNKKKIKIDGINWNYLADLTKRAYLHAIQFTILGFPPQDARWNFNIHFFSFFWWKYDSLKTRKQQHPQYRPYSQTSHWGHPQPFPIGYMTSTIICLFSKKKKSTIICQWNINRMCLPSSGFGV